MNVICQYTRTRTLLILSYDFGFFFLLCFHSFHSSIDFLRTRRPLEFASSALFSPHAVFIIQKFNASIENNNDVFLLAALTLLITLTPFLKISNLNNSLHTRSSHWKRVRDWPNHRRSNSKKKIENENEIAWTWMVARCIQFLCIIDQKSRRDIPTTCVTHMHSAHALPIAVPNDRSPANTKERARKIRIEKCV